MNTLYRLFSYLASYHIDEWQKTLLGTTIGFLVGILAEPLKTKLTESQKSRNLRKLCYQSVADIYGTMQMILFELTHPGKVEDGISGAESARRMMLYLDVGLLKYAMDSDSARLYSLDIAATIIAIMADFKEVDESISVERVEEIADYVVNRIDSDVDDRRINGDYLTRMVFRAQWNQRRREKVITDKERKDYLRFGYKNNNPYAGVYALSPIRLFFGGWSNRSTNGRRIGPAFAGDEPSLGASALFRAPF